MFSGDMIDLDPAGVLAVAESVVSARRATDRDEIRLVLHWADLHSGDPQSEPDAVPVRHGGDRLIALGGQGTPMVAELCWAELAVARRTGVVATRNLAADALDLRHRLPSVFAKVERLEIEVWLARKVASMSRRLSAEGARLIDGAVAAADDLHPGRLLALVEAKVIEADLEAHRARVACDATRTGVWVQRPRPGDVLGGEPGVAGAATRGLAARLALGQVLELDAMIDEVADHLSGQDDYRELTRDQLRAEALALMAFPDRVIALLHGPDEDGASVEEAGHGRHQTRSPRRPAVVYVHVSEAALAGVPAVVRCERLGPLLTEQVSELLKLRDVTVQPVIDLNGVHAVNGYEHPTAVRRRTLLRTGGDVFPHSTNSSGRLDHDHVRPYDPLGPPGQTGDLNAAPLTRFHHRVKTHQHGWQVEQLALATYRWVSPHGLVRVVTPRGTRVVQGIHDDSGRVVGELYPDRGIALTLGLE